MKLKLYYAYVVWSWTRMATIFAHDQVMHYNGRKTRLPNVNSTRHTYINMPNGVSKKNLNRTPGNMNILMDKRCTIPRTYGRYSNPNVHEMF